MRSADISFDAVAVPSMPVHSLSSVRHLSENEKNI